MLFAPSTRIASAGHAHAQSSQPTHFSRPSGWRFSWWRPWNRSSVGALTSGYSTVKRGRKTLRSVLGDVKGRTCVVIDDMIDTAGTICKAVDALFDEGAKDVIIAATHAVFSGPAIDRLKNSKASEVVVTDTLPIPVENRFDGLTVLSIAPLIARAIREVFEDGSVTSLFDGHS